jgi:NAD(P) transhydrogenase subunit beta
MICGWGRHVINIMCLIACAVLGVLFGVMPMGILYLGIMTVIAAFIGWHMVMAIGGADMPVVVSMLNSYSGWATAASGFLLNNVLLIITGALVGSSGAILSYIMCKAMNRSFFSVILGGFGQGATSGGSQPVPEGEPKPTNLKGFMGLVTAAKSIVIVPGYGMAVSRCQHDVGTLAATLRAAGKTVRFCIHPVAGRLPGHMNVLLAEANVPYDIVLEMDEINNEFASTDLVLVLGANDIVNPDALENPESPIAGMPVCEVWKSKNVVVFKRGAGAGYAGIENPLFIKNNTLMYYGSADKTIGEILADTKERYTGEKASANTLETTQEETEETVEDDSELPEAVARIGVPAEVEEGESRVAMVPSTVRKFRKLGFHVAVQSGAGLGSDFTDE